MAVGTCQESWITLPAKMWVDWPRWVKPAERPDGVVRPCYAATMVPPAPSPLPVLHAVFWHPNRLAFWAETAETAADVPRPHHPFAVPGTRLLTALPAVPGAAAVKVGLRLPTVRRRPLPSWERQPARLADWRVDAAAMPLLGAIDVLRGLDGLPAFRLGPEVVWLQALGQWADALVTAGHIQPVVAAGAGEPAGLWHPVLAGRDDAERLAAFAHSRPGVLTAAVESPGTPTTAEILAALVDAVAREALRQGRWLATKDPALLRRSDWAMHWLLSLVAPAGTGVLSEAQRHTLRQYLAGCHLSGMAPARSYHLHLRLAEPGRGSGWPLSILLQADDDPALTVDLATIRAGTPAPAPELASDINRFPEIARRLLWQAAPAFAPLWTVAQPDGPGRLTLNQAEAQRLLVEAAPKLAARGVTLAGPPGVTATPTPLQVHLTVRPTKASELGWSALCDFQWQVAIGEQTVSEAEFRQLIQQQRALVKVQGQWVVVSPESLAEAAEAVKRAQGKPVTLLAALHLLADHPAAAGGTVRVSAAGWLADLVTDRVSDEPVPATFQATLRPYQRRGLSWLAFSARLGLGACLADDMGLGKTVQLLALLAWERARPGAVGPTLLVAPMSVVGNWQREAARFVPSLRVYVHHGGSRQRGRRLADAAAGADLVITTYGLLARERTALAAIPWGRIVLDEAQHIKNAQSQQAKAAFALQAPHRVALTGTPVENRLAELWSLMHFLNPGLLGSFGQFQKTFAGADSPELARLQRLTAPFILRRRKQDPGIAPDLPEKWEITTYCTLTTEQAALYKAVVEEMLARIRQEAGMRRKGLILTMMTRLKQICDHPALVLDDDRPLSGRSGKLASLEDALADVLALGEKALVFTQFTGMAGRLVTHLQDVLQVPVAYLHGGLDKAARDRLVADFQSTGGPPVFVLSLKAGGVGLNLTAATHVIHYDRWWNPAVEDQATDRAHRIGQTRRVQVRRLICAGTLEERIAELIATKRDLAERVVGSSDDAWVTELSTDELQAVFALSADAVMEG